MEKSYVQFPKYLIFYEKKERKNTQKIFIDYYSNKPIALERN